MREVLPCVPVRAVVFTHGAPRALAEVGTPTLPVLPARSRFRQSNLFLGHKNSPIAKLHLRNRPIQRRLGAGRLPRYAWTGRRRFRSPEEVTASDIRVQERVWW